MGRICTLHVSGAGQVDVWINALDHCGPHVHYAEKGGTWEARVKFSFVDNLAIHWDFLAGRIGVGAVNDVCAQMVQYLRLCRTEWWRFFSTGIGCCLVNQSHPDTAGNLRVIQAATYDPATNSTHLAFTNGFTRVLQL